MDLQTYIDNAVKSARAKTLAESDQLTLGDLISEFETIVRKQSERIAEGKKEATVGYDFEYLYPTKIDSWRGSYNELALNFKAEGDKEMTASTFLQMLKDTVDKEFTGYKGGEFVMTRSTPVWVANSGHSGNTAIVGVVDEGYKIILITGYREF